MIRILVAFLLATAFLWEQSRPDDPVTGIILWCTMLMWVIGYCGGWVGEQLIELRRYRHETRQQREKLHGPGWAAHDKA